MRRFTKYPSNYVRASFYANDVIPVARDGEWEMYSPVTYKACRKLGGDTHWYVACSDPRWFDVYAAKGPVYIFINKSTGEKYASHPATKNWLMDVKDRNLGEEALASFLDEHPNFVINEFKDLLMDYGRNGWSFDNDVE